MVVRAMKHEVKLTIRTDEPGAPAASVASRVLEQAGLFGYALTAVRESDVYTNQIMLTVVSKRNVEAQALKPKAFYEDAFRNAVDSLTRAKFVSLYSSRLIQGTTQSEAEVRRILPDLRKRG